ncbi:hypothetical protein DSCW_07650 [Desulfosarcina widdelii]|uniref:Uncharacterized protein n=1 Tax=Desulfosarcina widdelii TaxID=947919 RepID=A0A5K7YXL2_9BACT|nr:hypothetical protein DSCW_07650 [Desulfosarcina widdelii]
MDVIIVLAHLEVLLLTLEDMKNGHLEVLFLTLEMHVFGVIFDTEVCFFCSSRFFFVS